MDRQIVYPGSVPLETDLLSSNRNAYLALAMLTQAVLGTNTVVDGLACTPGSGLTVQVGQGSIYSVAIADQTGYSSLAAMSQQIVKQGLLLTPAVLNCPVPGTVGQSINYLVEVQLQEADSSPVVLPYYNAAAPTIPWSGPSGSGTAQNTVRQDTCAVQVKAGTAATTGTQVTPTGDAGWTALYVVSVAYGASSISAGDINAVSGAPFIPTKLPNIQIPGWGLAVPAKTAAYIAAPGDRYGQDTSAGGFTVTLPPSPQVTDQPILIHDLAGTFAANKLVIDPGSNQFMGTAGLCNANLSYFSGLLAWSGSTYGWKFL